MRFALAGAGWHLPPVRDLGPDAPDVRTRPAARRHLIVVAAGRASRHPSWLRCARNWDLLCVDYDGGVDPGTCDVRVARAGMKWRIFSDVLREVDWSGYDRIGLFDDDLELDGDELSCVLDLASVRGWPLCQLSLTADSDVSHGILRQRPGVFFAVTDFVEVMAPIVSRTALVRIAPTFAVGSGTGWGLDFLWPRLLDCRGVVVHRYAMRHRRRESTYDRPRAVRDLMLVVERYSALFPEMAERGVRGWIAKAGRHMLGRERRTHVLRAHEISQAAEPSPPGGLR